MNRDEFLDWLVANKKEWPTIEQLDHIPLAATGWLFNGHVFVNANEKEITIHDWNRAKIKDGVFIQVNSDDECDYLEEIISGRFPSYEIVYDEFGTSFHFPNRKPSNKEIFIEMPKNEPIDINTKVLAEKVGSKHDQGKPRYDLIPPHAEAEFVDVLTFGATKYEPNQWRNVPNAKERYTAAAMRHMAAYRMGEIHDIESGKHHLAHAMCCLAFITELDMDEDK